MKVAAVVLAAGASGRLGRPKQLVERRGETLLHRAARIALEAGCDPVLVVLGFQGERMRETLADLPAVPVLNARWEEGMAASIGCGVLALPDDAGAVLLMACDQWALEAADLRRLLDAFHAAPGNMAAAAYGGGHGIPVIFPRTRFAALAALSGDRGAKILLAPDVSMVDMPTAQPDLDWPEDLDSIHEP